MDGVGGLTQEPIPPGATFKYEFTLKQTGTFLYHPHVDEMFQIALGMMGFFIIHPKDVEQESADRDFAIFLHEWNIPIGASTPSPLEMLDFNLFTFNGTLYPLTEPLVVKTGERVRIRLANIMMNSHPIHLHGYEFLVTRHGAQKLPPAAQYTAVTINVAPGETRDIEFIANNPGDWILHCHKAHHTMNQMGHNLPNLTGIEKDALDIRIRHFFPNFTGLMGTNGMQAMFEMYGKNHKTHHAPTSIPSNLSPIGNPGPFDVIELGGMFTILKVRDDLVTYDDPGWYLHPAGTTAQAVSIEEVPQKIRHPAHYSQKSIDPDDISWLSQRESLMTGSGTQSH